MQSKHHNGHTRLQIAEPYHVVPGLRHLHCTEMLSPTSVITVVVIAIDHNQGCQLATLATIYQWSINILVYIQLPVPVALPALLYGSQSRQT